MMDYDGEDVKNGFASAFGRTIDTITPEQMRFLVNLMKHARGRCRSNAALNNYLNRNFPHLNFKQVKKEGADYEVLEISTKIK